MLKTLIVPMPQSLKRGRETGKTGKEAKEKKNSELNIYKYSYEITSSFFLFFPPEKTVDKDNFLIETTYARTILGKKINFNPEQSLKIF